MKRGQFMLAFLMTFAVMTTVVQVQAAEKKRSAATGVDHQRQRLGRNQ